MHSPIDAKQSTSAGKCPVMHAQTRSAPPNSGTTVSDFWPNKLNVSVLNSNHPSFKALANPLDLDFDYAKAFQSLDLNAVMKDLKELMVTPQDWLPPDYGHYGPLLLRMAWHSAGTYRVSDGRGGAGHGNQRFAPINSWPDNVGLDKARRLLQPIKLKYGNKISWADLLPLAGTVALDSMGLATIGFAGGREDIWEPEPDVNWGQEKEWLADLHRYANGGEDRRVLDNPLAAVEMGLIYVNAEGPGGVPDPLAAARDIRVTFERMGFNDEETVALIAGGHSFGKAHGAADPSKYLGREPEAAPVEEMGLGWKNSFGSGKGNDTINSGLEGAWSATPTAWSFDFLDHLFGFEWELTTSPAGGKQWTPKNGDGAGDIPDAHDATKSHAPMMFTTDIAIKEDPIYSAIGRKYYADLDLFAKDFATAWFKLLHLDLGPKTRYLGKLVPTQDFLWQDPILAATRSSTLTTSDIADLKARILASGLSVSQLVSTAWASASTFRKTDKRGGANGARIRLLPQREWAVNEPAKLAVVLQQLETIQKEFNCVEKRVSMADLIVLGGNVGVEAAAKKANCLVEVPFLGGRGDADQEQTDVQSFAVLEPKADGFRNYLSAEFKTESAAAWMVEKANLLGLTAPEMTVLVGGLRVLGGNHGGAKHGVLTHTPEVLTNEFFVNLIDMNTQWRKASGEGLFEGVDGASGEHKWTATGVDLVFGSNAQLRGVAEVYAGDQGDKFVGDFVKAWTKVMNADL
ncbi:hypothetical protein HDU98_000169 [Podochytrium sp. JEL0797]|nr:hypothetical protein HDU98_000169 [Podochytrium sp. JEL0797]